MSDVVDLLQDQAARIGLADLAVDRLDHRISPSHAGAQRLRVLAERGDGLLVGLLLRSPDLATRTSACAISACVSALKSSAPRRLSSSLNSSSAAFPFSFALATLNALLDRLDGLVLVREVLEFLPGGSAAAVLQIVNERLEGLLDDGGGDLLVLRRARSR